MKYLLKTYTQGKEVVDISSLYILPCVASRVLEQIICSVLENLLLGPRTSSL